MRKLYFKHSNGSLSYICDIDNEDLIVNKALEDLYKRNPNYQSYYQRVYIDDNGWTHIDAGSWSEEYIIKED